METTYQIQFGKKYYQSEIISISRKTITCFEKDVDEMRMGFCKGINNYMDQIIDQQGQNLLPPISRITISFLFSSYYFREPFFRLDCYGVGDYMFAPSLFTELLSADWMTKFVPELEETLLQIAKREGLGRYIRKSWIHVLGLRAVRSLLIYFAGRMKYLIEASAVEGVKKEDKFALSMGEFMDWQRPLYMQLPMIDLLQCGFGTSLRFRTFRAGIYENERLNDLDLTSASFIGCTFQSTVIVSCIMNDCLFQDCIFESVNLEDTQLFGSSFINCRIENTSYSNVLFSPVGHRVQELYKNAEFNECSLSHIQFRECDLNECKLNLCSTEMIEIMGGFWMHSDFEKI